MRKGLREQLQNQTLPEDELSDLEQQLLRQMLDRQLAKEWNQELEKQGIVRMAPTRSIRARLIPWMAAAAVILIGAFGWLWLMQAPAPQRMAAQYLEQPFAWSGSNRDGDVNNDPERSRSLFAYQKGDYQTALNAISPLLALGQAEDLFLAGLCYQNLSRHKEAVSMLEKARTADANFYRDEINWFLGLNYVMLGDKENARSALQRVVDSNSSRNKAAAHEILEKLR